MHDAATRQAQALEGGDHLGVGAAHVQQGGQFEFPRQLQLGFEQRLLGRLVRLFHVMVEADLAHRAELGMAGPLRQALAQLREMFGAMPVEEARMQAEAGVQAILGAGQRPQAVPVILGDADQHLALDAQCPAARQHGGAVGVEFREVQMVVGVDIAHGAQDSAGLLPLRDAALPRALPWPGQEARMPPTVAAAAAPARIPDV